MEEHFTDDEINLLVNAEVALGLIFSLEESKAYVDWLYNEDPELLPPRLRARLPEVEVTRPFL